MILVNSFKLPSSKIVLAYLLLFSIYFGNTYIDVGIALKPYMLSFVIIFIYLHRNKLVMFFTNYEKFMIIFMTLFSLTVFQFRFPEVQIRFVFALILLLTFYLIVKQFFILIDYKILFKIFSNVGFIIVVVTLLYYILGIINLKFNFYGNDIVSYGVLIDRNMPRLIGFVSSDPNILAFFLSPYLFFTIFNYHNSLKNKIGLILSIIVIVLTFSRGAYFSFLLCFVIILFLNINRINLKVIITTILVCASVLFLFSNFKFISVNKIIIDRFTSVLSDGGSGRKTLWLNALNTFKEHPIFGIGINSSLGYNIIAYNDSHYTHNTILEVLSEGGIIVFIFFVLFITTLTHKIYVGIKINKKFNFIHLSIIAMLIQMIFLSILYSEIFYLMIAMFSAYEYKNKRGIRNE